jgi:hypothetical protein
MKGMDSNVFFHIIDAKTTFNMLFGQPWIYENDIVSLMTHQCCQNKQVRKLVVNNDPFTIGKTHFTDAKLYFKLTMMKAP